LISFKDRTNSNLNIFYLFITGLPTKPTGPMDVSELTKTSAKLSWKPPSNDGGSPLTGYIIEKKEGRRTTWARCDKISPDVTTYNVKNLTEGT
jgi:titin